MLATVALALATFGCSGDSSVGPSEYRRQLARVCRDLRHQMAAVPDPSGATSDQLVRAGRRALARQRTALDRLRAVPAPGADRHRVAQWLVAVDAALDAGRASLDAQARGDLAAARAANARGLAASTRAAARARTLRVTARATV